MEQYNKRLSCVENCSDKHWNSNLVKFDLFLLGFNEKKNYC